LAITTTAAPPATAANAVVPYQPAALAAPANMCVDGLSPLGASTVPYEEPTSPSAFGYSSDLSPAGGKGSSEA